MMRTKSKSAKFGSRVRVPAELSPLVTDTKTTLLVKTGGKTLCYNPSHETDMESSSEVFNDPHHFARTMTSYHNQNEQQSTRQRMRPWLESRIDSGAIPGLEWINKEEKIFKVPWKHVGNREWIVDDAVIFKEWAVHTGRYREGVDQPDYPVWKTRFRCALTKLPDIKELREMNNLDGQYENPYRVYKFLPKAKESTRQQSGMDYSFDDVDGRFINGGGYPSAVKHHYPKGDSTDGRLPDDLANVYGDNITTNFDCMDISGGGKIEINDTDERMDSDLNRIPTGDLICCRSSDIKPHMDCMDITGGPDIQTSEDIHRKAQKPMPGACGQEVQPISPNELYLDREDKKLHITIRYRSLVMQEQLISHEKGCRIYHDPNLSINCTTEEYSQIFGPVDAFPLNLPECSRGNDYQNNMTTKLLNVLDRGVFVSVENGDIYATRFCRCSIFFSSPSVENGATVKVNREEKTKIFDLNNYFIPALALYLQDKGPKPSAQVQMSFGQRFDSSKDQTSDLLISATIVHAEASNLMAKIACTDPMSPPIEISKSDNVDRYMDMARYQQRAQQDMKN